MRDCKLLSSRLYVKLFLLLLAPFLGGTGTAYAQFTWQSGGHNFDNGIGKLYVDPLDSTLWVLGGYQNVDGQSAPKGITRLGTNGQILSFPDCPYDNNLTVLRWNGNLFVGGAKGLARYDGTRWYKIDSNRQFSVYSLCAYGNKLAVGGLFYNSSGYESILMAYEVGKDTLVNAFGADTSLPVADGVYDMAVYKGKLYVAGRFEPLPPVNSKFSMIACWNGTSWEALQQGITDGGQGNGSDYVGGLEVYNDTLFVAGYFDQYFGAPGNSIAKWDGQNWHSVGRGTEVGRFNKLKNYRGGLVAMGNFSELERYSCASIGFYKDGQWCRNWSLTYSVISGVDFAGDFWVATSYMVGLDTMRYLAKITSMGTCVPAGIANSFSEKPQVTVFPNPSAGSFNLQCRGGNSNALVSCRVTDITGRLMWENESAGSDVQIDANQWPAGIYLLYLKDEKGVLHTQKIVKE